MPYSKTIVCLANSRKLTGRCVAGKEWDGEKPGAWCRPVSAKERGELTAERWYRRTWRDPQLLDLIEVSLLAPRPSGCQRENYLVDESFRWRFAGRVSVKQLISALDHPAGPLWMNGDSTVCGHNDKVPALVAERRTYSLVLVQPEQLSITVGTEGAERGFARRRVRGRFLARRTRLCSGHYRSGGGKTDSAPIRTASARRLQITPSCVLASVKSSRRKMPVTKADRGCDAAFATPRVSP